MRVMATEPSLINNILLSILCVAAREPRPVADPIPFNAKTQDSARSDRNQP